MTASLLFSLVWLAAALLGCAPSARDARPPGSSARAADGLVTAHGELLADGTCRVAVNGAPLFSAHDAPRSSYDAGAMAEGLAPAGYELHQLACAPGDATSTLPPERADERLVLITVYLRSGSSLRAGRYVVRPGLAEVGDTAGISARAGIALFGSPATASHTASAAGVRYLEGRDGTLEITSADGPGIVGRFDVRLQPAWSM